MSSWFNLGWLWDLFGFGNKQGKLLFLGLDHAGKTTLLGMLSTNRLHSCRQTFNPNTEELQLGGVNCKVIDMGGHVEARRLWKDYFTVVDGVVFIVDASAPERFPEAKQELDRLLAEEELSRAPFVVLGNKIDLVTSVPADHLANALGLTHLRTGQNVNAAAVAGAARVRPVEVFMCSVVKKAGYADGFRWLAQFIGNA
jgi:GTP-binding protein SAR1